MAKSSQGRLQSLPEPAKELAPASQRLSAPPERPSWSIDSSDKALLQVSTPSVRLRNPAARPSRFRPASQTHRILTSCLPKRRRRLANWTSW